MSPRQEQFHIAEGIRKTFGRNVFDAESADMRVLSQEVRAALARDHAIYIRNFARVPRAFVEFLSEFGSPLSSYSSGPWPEAGSYGGVLNRVRCLPASATAGRTHERGGALPAHTARSWRDPIPALFAILMVNPGWQNQPSGQNGESLLVPWREVVRVLSQLDDATGTPHLRILLETPIRFGANHVREPELNGPIAFLPYNPRDSFDYGIRLRSGILEVLEGMRARGSNVGQLRNACAELIRVADEIATEHRYQMQVGDLAVVDNHRYGHGRLDVVSERPDRNGSIRTNPRELWSATLDTRNK